MFYIHITPRILHNACTAPSPRTTLVCMFFNIYTYKHTHTCRKQLQTRAPPVAVIRLWRTSLLRGQTRRNLAQVAVLANQGGLQALLSPREQPKPAKHCVRRLLLPPNISIYLHRPALSAHTNTRRCLTRLGPRQMERGGSRFGIIYIYYIYICVTKFGSCVNLIYLL